MLAYEPISLGSACEAKFQLCRKLYKDFYGKSSEASFRVQMMAPERGQRAYGWHAFDWQRTPFSALLQWLDRDFDGVFEREDLRVEGDFVLHGQFGTEHSHQFDGFRRGWTERDLDAAYSAIRRRFDKRVERFRDMLTKPGPYLYVWTASPSYTGTDFLPPADEVRRLLELLSAQSKDHQFHLLMAANPGKDQDYSGLEGQVTKVFKAEDTGKTPAMDWEGNDARWSEILAPFSLTLRDRDPVAKPAAMTQEIAPSPKVGAFARLFGR